MISYPFLSLWDYFRHKYSIFIISPYFISTLYPIYGVFPTFVPIMWKLFLLPMLLLQFTSVDREFRNATDYTSCRQKLEEMLPQAAPGAEKAEVLWRLSRIALMQGEQAADKKAKRELHNQGIRYAQEGIQEDPKNEQCYMWHCANVGRECMTHGLADQAKAVPAMQKDLTTILDVLGRVRCSEAWQGLSELYWKHPFKSKESAMNFARRAAYTIPSDELRLSTYLYLAQLLEERDWSADKRAAQAAAHNSKYSGKAKSNIDKYAVYDGSDDQMPWLKGAIGEVSDEEEAEALIQYALSRYKACKDLSPVDKKDFEAIQQWQKNLK